MSFNNHIKQTVQFTEQTTIAPADVTAVIIDPLVSNVHAQRFYQRLGFKFVENRMFDEDHCAVYQLTRSDWENVQ